MPMNVLYYWRRDNYIRDRKFGFGYHLNQNSPVLGQVTPGSTVWAFTRDRYGRYVLAAELVAKAVTTNSPRYRYGRFRVWGDPALTKYFDVDIGPGAEELIRRLRVTTQASILAQSFQGHSAVKGLDQSDHQLLCSFTQRIPVLERVGFYPEDEFEARLLVGPQVQPLQDPSAQDAVRIRYLFESVDIRRARRHVEWLQRAYTSQCQICLFDPQGRYSRNLAHGHHIQWLSRGGEDSLDNMVLICPNHHAAVHQDDAVFDYRTLSFYFSNGLVEELQLNRHLERAA
jgi:hypothetical protein